MPRSTSILIASLAFAAPFHASAAIVTERSLASPDGTLAFTLERDDSNQKLYWSLNRGGTPIVSRGSLGIDITNVGTVADEGSISQADSRSVDTTWTPPYGERASIPDHFNEQTLTLSHTDHGALTVKLQIRAYDEGLAFRYLLNGTGTLTMSGEKTSYPLPTSASVWASSSSQSTISKVAITSMGNGMERPLTAELSPNLFIAVGEAGSFDHARMKFSRVSGTSTLVPALGGSATFTGSITTPWRYVRAAGTAPGLLESNHLVLNLSEPSRVADTSWLKPGKMLREATLTTAGGIACVDWCAAHGIDFVHFDAGWYGPENNASSDATTVNVDPARSPGPLDLQAVISHAKSKNIGVILYVNHLALEAQLDEILPLYKQWGVDGIKFGFVNTGSQQWTKWLHDSIEKCAQHQLMVDVHDDYRMMGTERTLPNFMTAEGIRGDEESPPNEMVLRTIFTRCLAGAGDQTNCYFASRVNTMGSHASQLAKSVLIYSPWQYLYWYDSPENSPNVGGKASVLQDVPELSFFERLPTVWDETRWLQGHPETHAVVARRKGQNWFIGGLNGTSARDFNIPLDFLPANQNYRIEVYRDDNSVNTITDVQIDAGVVDRGFTLTRTVGSRNGIAVILTPTSDPLTPLAATVGIDPPPPPPPTGMIRFETDQNYPAANADIAAVNSNPAGTAYTGTNGWSLSNSSSAGRVLSTGNSGEYAGGQAIGTNGSGTYIGGLRGSIQAAATTTIQFDAQYNTGITVGFMKDLDGDGLFEVSDTGMGFGIGGASAVRFQRRNAAFGTETASPLAGTGGQWYRFTVTIGASQAGSRSITMAVRNLSAASDLDFDTATAGTQAWTFNVTDAAFGPSPEDADGIFVRLTAAAKVDNLLATVAAPPYNVWIHGFPNLADPDRLPGVDPDADGISNLLEYALGGDPTMPDSSVLPFAAVSGNLFQFHFHRRDESENDTSLVLQHRSNLLDTTPWTDALITAGDGSSGMVSWTVNENGINPDLVTASIPMDSAENRFVRLLAYQIP